MAELNLFQTDRTTRQKYCLKQWIKYKCKATIEAVTGFGKSRTGLMAIKLLKHKFPNIRCLIVVPTDVLKLQWEAHLVEWDLVFNCDVYVINTIVKNKWIYDFLVIDEIHRAAADILSKVFECVTYKYILGLTATLDRLDGKESIVKKYCPICDRVGIEEALLNKWVSPYKEYAILIHPKDINIYNDLTAKFNRAFGFFSYDFNLAMSCIGGKKAFEVRKALAKQMSNGSNYSEMLKAITANSMIFTKTMQERKKYINNHPTKILLARKIIEAYPDKKIITFSNNIKMAEAIQNGENVYTGKLSKTKSRVMMEDFNKQNTGVLNTIKKVDEGVDVKGLSVAIMLGIDSSAIRNTQRVGRAIRFSPNKQALIFYLLIDGTKETEWLYKNHKNDLSNVEVIDERQLDNVLQGKEYKKHEGNLARFTFRF